MNILRNIRYISAVLSLPFVLASCGIMDLQDAGQAPTAMHLDHRDTIYVMQGDQVKLQPLFTPDTVQMQQVLWMTTNEQVLSLYDGVFTAENEGTAMIRAVSVAWQFEDSCTVSVMPRWENTAERYPYEMVVYADVTVHGKPFDSSTMMAAAFVNGQMRGVGELMEQGGKRYVRFRVGSDLNYTGASNEVVEDVTFRLYHRKEMRCEDFPLTIRFDAETHGTLSALIDMKIK